MAFRCPQCKTSDSLEIIASIELPPDRLSTEISLQVVACKVCKFRGLAVYEEPRANAAEIEAFRHTGFWVSPDAVDSALGEINACPDPHNRYCTCAVHASLGQKDLGGGRWRGLLEMERGHTFMMRLAY